MFIDAVLECLGGKWELHCPFLNNSNVLFELYTDSKRERVAHLKRGGIVICYLDRLKVTFE